MDCRKCSKTVRREVSVVQPPAYNRFALGFGHIFAGGYSAGYYSYSCRRHSRQQWRTLSVDVMSQDGQGGGDVRKVEITPVRSQRKTIFGEDETAWLVGVRASSALRPMSSAPRRASPAAGSGAGNMIVLTWEGFVKLIERVVPADQVGGPIMIAQVIGEQAHNGLEGLLGLAALISINTV